MYLSGKKAGEEVYDSLLYHFKVDENTFCRLTKKKASFYLKRIKILRKRLQNRRLNASRPGIVYSDNAPELESATSKYKVRHNTSRPYVHESKSVVEREIRTILEGTRANLCQSGMPDKLCPLTAQHHAMASNLQPTVGLREDNLCETFLNPQK